MSNSDQQAASIADELSPRTDQSDDNPIEQIRDILLGPSLVSFDKRFQRLEEMILTNHSRLLKLLDKRIESVESQIAHQDTRLSRDLEQEKNAHVEAIGSLESHVEKQERTLRGEIDEIHMALTAQLQELKTAMDENAESLRENGRQQNRELASLFQSIASQLNKADEL